MRSVNSISHKVFILFAILSSKKPAGCNPITNSNLNDHIRDFSLKEDNINTTRIKTLQKEEPGRYANFAPGRNSIRFKDSDSAISSSSYNRGHHHEHPGYDVHDYDDSPHPYGYEEYHIHDPGHDHQLYEHHVPTVDYYPEHHGGRHHIGHHHHKHYDHALAAKAILWPIAGIALLGAAAALVSNPVLLQLGVVSGRRKRRDTEETFGPSVDSEELSWLNDKHDFERSHTKPTENGRLPGEQEKHANIFMHLKSTPHYNSTDLKHRVPKKVNLSVKQEALFRKVYPTAQSSTKDSALNNEKLYFVSKEINDNKLIPVPLIVKEVL